MEALVWGILALDPVLVATPLLLNVLLILALAQSDFVFLLSWQFCSRVSRTPDSFQRLGARDRPSAMVIIPSLLRGNDDLSAIQTTVESAATNGYPSDLFVIASVDGRTDSPALYAQLERWVSRRRDPPNVRVAVTGNETRLGKMMAVEAGVSHMKDQIARGLYPRFPEVYFSIDGDGTLGAFALERLAHELSRRNRLTGNPRRIVSGKICIRPDLIWRGWRRLFSVEGLLYMLVAREFLVSNVSRFNWKWTPRIGVPGALYCTWSSLLLQAPHFMAFAKTLSRRDWLRWWLGAPPPQFSRERHRALPEALTGASDDTCMAFLASMATFQRGDLVLLAPRTPLHAFGRLLRSYFWERSHAYAPEARVYTYTPSTLRALWRQRVRWNSSRVECAGRFSRAFAYHWEIGLPTSAHLLNLLTNVFEIAGYYILLPYFVLGDEYAALGYVLGYAAQTLSYTLYTLMALALEREWRHFLPTLLVLPLASAYQIGMNAFGCIYGVVRDVFLFGNATNFAPEWTLKAGGCVRVALAFRVRRLLALCLRALLYRDVPLGRFWFGWRETPWTPSGFDGWTTGTKPRAILPRPRLDTLLEAARPTLRLAGATLGAIGLSIASLNAVGLQSTRAPAPSGLAPRPVQASEDELVLREMTPAADVSATNHPLYSKSMRCEAPTSGSRARGMALVAQDLSASREQCGSGVRRDKGRRASRGDDRSQGGRAGRSDDRGIGLGGR